MDTLTLKSLYFHAKHGLNEKERIEGNQFEVDLIFYGDLKAAGKTDEISQTIDYEKAEQTVRGVMEGPSVKLIETLASKIGDQLLKNFKKAQQLEVRIRKMDPPLSTQTEYSQITYRWSR